jgi:copper homeostasis protein
VSPISNRRVVTEVCVDAVAGAQAAARGGADRIELCAALELGGITPSAGMLESVTDLIPTHVLIRCRGGDFVYDSAEIRVMAKDVELAIDRGAASVVVGALTADGDVDLPAMVRLLGAAGDVPVTFHRAFDSARDPLAALDDLLELGVERLLTSGGARTAVEGAEVIAELVRRSGTDLTVLPGSGVTPQNAAALILATGAHELHSSARTAVASSAPAVQVGPMDGGVRYRTDPDVVAAIVAAVSDLPGQEFPTR